MKPAHDCTSIDEIRTAIDSIDKNIIELIGERFKYVKAIVQYKEPTEEGIVAKSRFESVLASRREIALENGLDPEIIEKMYRDLIMHFIAEERKILEEKTN